jgi:hypothetical protein
MASGVIVPNMVRDADVLTEQKETFNYGAVILSQSGGHKFGIYA